MLCLYAQLLLAVMCGAMQGAAAAVQAPDPTPSLADLIREVVRILVADDTAAAAAFAGEERQGDSGEGPGG